MGQSRGDGEFGLRKFTGSKSSGYLQKKKNRFSFFAVRKIKNIYLHSVLKESGFREFSSAGSEHLPYKQRVGGSNPSTPTSKPQIGAFLFLFETKKAAEGRGPRWLSGRIPQLPLQSPKSGLFCFYSKRKRPQRVGVRDGYRDESLNSHFKAPNRGHG
jgi:hypothetical protein